MALIMVIGLLALMMVMAVAFAVYMRTERVASGAFRNDVRARQFLHVAMARALADLDANLGNNPYPDWDVFVSTNGSVNIDGVTNSPVLDWIPRAPLLAGISPWPKWVDVTSVRLERGRIGYMIVNCSGLLDANVAGDGVTARSIGTNVCEIQLGNCPEVILPGQLVADRSPKYETIQELGEIGRASGALALPITDFVTYSASPTNSVEFIGGGSASLRNNTNIIGGFINAGYNSTQAGVLFTNLLDYVDGDVEPGNLGVAGAGNAEGPYVEPVWMVNEVYLSNTVCATPIAANTYDLQGTNFLKFEVVFPFKGGASMVGFRLNYTLTIVGSSVPALSLPAPVSGSFMISGAGEYYVAPYGPGYRPIPFPGGVQTAGSITWTATAEVRVWITKGSIVVDSVTNSPVVLPISMGLNLPLVPVVPVPPVSVSFSADVDRECCDARLNYDPTKWAAPRPNSLRHTLGTTNNLTLRYWGGAFVGVVDRVPGWESREYDTAIYVKGFSGIDKPLDVTGELGYLFIGDAWRTVRLFTRANPLAPLYPVLDYFTAKSIVTPLERGLVNPNAASSNVVNAVYSQMFLDFPHGSGATRLIGSTLNSMNQALRAMTATNKIARLSDLGRLDANQILTGSTYSELDKESLVRNVADLLTVRQNYFMILIFGESTRSVAGLGTTGLAGARALAEVWRDSHTNSVGVHPRIIRFFKILENE
ncbi:MAG: hypothetical protein WCI03_03020 [bacterium]